MSAWQTGVLIFRIVVFVFCAAVVALHSKLHAAGPVLVGDPVLLAIRAVEGVEDPALAGPAQELGYYRITPAAWMQHTGEAFSRCAADRALEEQVARAHLRWLEAGLRRARVIRPETSAATRVYYLALAWNAGLAGVLRGHPPATARSYAMRATNLWRDAGKGSR